MSSPILDPVRCHLCPPAAAPALTALLRYFAVSGSSVLPKKSWGASDSARHHWLLRQILMAAPSLFFLWPFPVISFFFGSIRALVAPQEVMAGVPVELQLPAVFLLQPQLLQQCSK